MFGPAILIECMNILSISNWLNQFHTFNYTLVSFAIQNKQILSVSLYFVHADLQNS